MNIRIVGDEIKDSGKKIGVINGHDIYTYPNPKRIGRRNGNDVYNASGSKVGYGDEGVIKLFLSL